MATADTNKISIEVYKKNGDEQAFLENATPMEAIKFLVGDDTGIPVQTLSITIVDSDGKQHIISIFPTGVVVRTS
jgi:hypothetical protein